MTLLLTEVSCFGVAMAADSAVTCPTGRVYIGAQKLLPVPQINAGLSIWGRGTIGDEDADIWVQEFIRKDVSSRVRLWDMANFLAEKLNRQFGGPITDRMGIHVAGFDEENGVLGPAFYHIHNGHYHIEYREGVIEEIPDEKPPIREFRAHKDRSPAIYTEDKYPILTRNGDFSILALLYDILQPMFVDIHRLTGLQFPFPQNLAARGEYLRFWINTVKEIYRISNYRLRILPEDITSGDAHVGGPVTVLTISQDGIENFYSK